MSGMAGGAGAEENMWPSIGAVWIGPEKEVDLPPESRRLPGCGTGLWACECTSDADEGDDMSMLLTEKNPEALEGIRGRPSSMGEGVWSEASVCVLDDGPRDETSLDAKDCCLAGPWPGAGGDGSGGWPRPAGKMGCCLGVTGYGGSIGSDCTRCTPGRGARRCCWMKPGAMDWDAWPAGNEGAL